MRRRNNRENSIFMIFQVSKQLLYRYTPTSTVLQELYYRYCPRVSVIRYCSPGIVLQVMSYNCHPIQVLSYWKCPTGTLLQVLSYRNWITTNVLQVLSQMYYFTGTLNMHQAPGPNTTIMVIFANYSVSKTVAVPQLLWS